MKQGYVGFGLGVCLSLAACGPTYPARVEDPSTLEETDPEEGMAGTRPLVRGEQDEPGCRDGGRCSKSPEREFSSADCPKPGAPLCVFAKRVCSYGSDGCEVCHCRGTRSKPPQTPTAGDSQSGNILEPPH